MSVTAWNCDSMAIKCLLLVHTVFYTVKDLVYCKHLVVHYVVSQFYLVLYDIHQNKKLFGDIY